MVLSGDSSASEKLLSEARIGVSLWNTFMLWQRTPTAGGTGKEHRVG